MEFFADVPLSARNILEYPDIENAVKASLQVSRCWLSASKHILI